MKIELWGHTLILRSTEAHRELAALHRSLLEARYEADTRAVEAAEARGREGRIIERVVEVANEICGPHPVPKSTTSVIELLNEVERAYAANKASIETIERQDQRLTAVRNALSGLPAVEPYPEDDEIDNFERSLRAGGRVIPPEEQIRRLRADLAAAKDLLAELTAERGNTGTALHRLALAENERDTLRNEVAALRAHELAVARAVGIVHETDYHCHAGPQDEVLAEVRRLRARVSDLEEERLRRVRSTTVEDAAARIGELEARVAELEEELAATGDQADGEAPASAVADVVRLPFDRSTCRRCSGGTSPCDCEDGQLGVAAPEAK